MAASNFYSQFSHLELKDFLGEEGRPLPPTPNLSRSATVNKTPLVTAMVNLAAIKPLRH